MDEKTSLMINDEHVDTVDYVAMSLNISVVDDVVHLNDARTLGYRTYNYNNLSDKTQKIVIFFPGAGFGRTHNPLHSKSDQQLILKHNIAFIIIERPGYGQSDAMNDENRHYKSYADDINFICTKHFKFGKPVYFMAHSAGCPHLLSVAAFYPSLIEKCAIVCPPNPCHGSAPDDRPQENCGRSIQRCCLLHCLCCLMCCFKPLINKWQRNPAEFTKFAKQNFAKIPVEKQFFDDNPEFIKKQQNDFAYAVSKSKSGGGHAMIQDMFIINSRDWGFKIKDINVKEIFVWYGTDDIAAPNGKWYCDTLKNSVERRLDGFGHSAIFIRNKEILLDLISE